MAGYLTDEGHALVSDAVSRAEANTAGEVVTILTDRSDGYSDIAMAWAAAASFLALAVLSLAPDFWLGLADRLFGHWSKAWTPGEVLALAAGVAMAKFAGALLIQLWPPLRFALVPAYVKTARVRARALTCFRVGADRRTQGRTGVLIYLSMRERRAEIIADRAIAEAVGARAWEEAMAVMLAHLRAGRVAEGMAAAVERVGVVLAEHCPRHADDVNELPDRLIEV